MNYVTAKVAYTDVTSTVTETGTVNPVIEIQIGTQVSGTIATLNVDYNSKVTTGQVFATLDPTHFQASVAQDTANLAAAQATAPATQSGISQAQAAVQAATATLAQPQASLRSAQANAERVAGHVDAREYDRAAGCRVAEAGVYSAESDGHGSDGRSDGRRERARRAGGGAGRPGAGGGGVVATAGRPGPGEDVVVPGERVCPPGHGECGAGNQAQYNLGQTIIKSPVNGIVMARNVTVGQTVAASLSTPTLFTLATNLTDMQVDTSVDEADIGNVKTGDARRSP